jgi:hypothetical protein
MSIPNVYEIILGKLDELQITVARLKAENLDNNGADSFKFIRFEPAREKLGVSGPTLRLYTSKKKIRHYKFGHYVYYKIEDLNEFIEKGRIEPAKRFSSIK